MVVEIAIRVVQEHEAYNVPNPDSVERLNFAIPFRSCDETLAQVWPIQVAGLHAYNEQNVSDAVNTILPVDGKPPAAIYGLQKTASFFICLI